VDRKLYQLDLPPQILSRGFWLYVWDIISPTGDRLCYVGMTGDVTGAAQSPYVRAGTHLGFNANNNAVRRLLKKRDLEPERCTRIKFFAYGPLFQYAHNAPKDHEYEANRKCVGAVERQLWTAAKAAKNTMLNERPRFSDTFDKDLWDDVRIAFAPCLNLRPDEGDTA